jgi:hypothetical protein
LAAQHREVTYWQLGMENGGAAEYDAAAGVEGIDPNTLATLQLHAIQVALQQASNGAEDQVRLLSASGSFLASPA